MSNERLLRYLPLLLTAGVLMIFAPVLKGDFVFDDFYTITDALRVDSAGDFAQRLSPGGSAAVGEATWRPLTTLTYVAVYNVFGKSPWAHHAVDWLLHAAVALLLLLLLRRLGLSIFPAMAGTLVFALHPLTAGTVAMISFREEPLAALCGLGALLLLSGKGKARIGGGLTLVGATTLAKETGVAFGPLTALMPGREGRARWLPAATATLISGVLGLFLLSLSKGGHETAFALQRTDSDFATRLATAGTTVFAYLKRLVIWRDLSPVHDDVAFNGFTVGAIVGLLFLLLLAALVVRGLQRPGCGALAAGLALFTLLPTLNLLVPTWSGQADRFCYLPLLGLGVAVGWAVEQVWTRARVESPGVWRLANVALIAVLTLLAVGVSRELPRYRNTLTLFHSVYQRQPESELGRFYFAQELLRLRRPDLAEELLTPLYEAHRDSLKMAKITARCYLDLGRADDAIAVLDSRELTGSDGAAAAVTLQAALFAAGRYDDGMALTRAWAERTTMPEGDRALFLANAALAASGTDLALAVQFAEAALQLNPQLSALREQLAGWKNR